MKILVVGESATDIFQYGQTLRVSPEAPCMVFTPTYKTENDGMAANVVANLKSLSDELEIEFITNVSKIFKIRYVEQRSNQHIMRQDINDHVSEKFRLGGHSDASVVVVSDYNKGFLSIEDLTFLSYHFPLSFLDTKKSIGSWASGFTFIKINETEYNNRAVHLDSMIVTKGDKGATYKGKDYPVDKPQVIMDVSGAGDTFLAGLVHSYIMTSDIGLSINFANKCASSVIQKRGVSTL